jgi:hypothetical protein
MSIIDRGAPPRDITDTLEEGDIPPIEDTGILDTQMDRRGFGRFLRNVGIAVGGASVLGVGGTVAYNQFRDGQAAGEEGGSERGQEAAATQAGCGRLLSDQGFREAVLTMIPAAAISPDDCASTPGQNFTRAVLGDPGSRHINVRVFPRGAIDPSDDWQEPRAIGDVTVYWSSFTHTNHTYAGLTAPDGLDYLIGYNPARVGGSTAEEYASFGSVIDAAVRSF